MSIESSASDEAAAMTSSEQAAAGRLLTAPNVLSAFRLVGSLALIGVSLGGQTQHFAILFGLLVVTDWVDGRLARWLHQRTEWGARLDSLADAVLFGALLFGTVMLQRPFLLAEWPWLAVALGSYLLTTGAGLWKFGRVPAYHTWAAKASWHVVLIAVVFVFMEWSPWPFRLAMLAVTLTNLEATLITRTLPAWRTDVWSVFHARRIRDCSPTS